MAVGPKGIDVRQTLSGKLVFRASLKDSAGAKLTTGTTTIYLYEVQDDGTLKSYDFSDNTFKTTALTTETGAMTHRTGNNSTTNTGVWTYALSTVTGFTVGGPYIVVVSNAGASPPQQEREFQFGGDEGDVLVNAAGNHQVDLVKIDNQATNGNNATLFLKQLNINNNAGNALLALSSGGNGHGIAATGQGAGHGISAVGGATGNGFRPSGVIGINASGSAGAGILGAGTGANPGARFTAGLTGNGVDIVGGGTSGHGINITTTDGNGIFGTIAGAAKFLINGTIALTGNIIGLINGNAVAGDAMTLTAAYNAAKTAAQPGDAMTLTAAERTATGARLEAMILDEADATALLQAIATKVEQFLINEGDANATLAAIAAAVRTNLTAELARIDVVLSSRLSTAGYTVPPTAVQNATQARTELTPELARILLALPAFVPGNTNGVPRVSDLPTAAGIAAASAAQVTTDHGVGSYQRNTEPDNAGIASIIDQLVTAIGEPGQGDLPVSAGRMAKLDYCYKILRNKAVQSPTSQDIYNDAGTVVDHKRPITVVGSDVTLGKVVSGP